MNQFIILLAMVAITVTACNNNNQRKITEPLQSTGTGDTTTAIHPLAAHDTTVFPMQAIIANYLHLKNALTKDNGKEAAVAASAMAVTLGNVHKTTLTVAQQTVFTDLRDDMKENAEHIGANAAKIDHQREHFQLLSKDMEDLVKSVGNGGQILYKDFCPMADKGKGAVWLSEIREISNPYLGSKMPECGSVKETFK